MTEPRQHLLPSRPTVLSLFAGIGGIDRGLEAAGCTTVAYSELDPYASRIMALRFPNARALGDVTAIDWSTVERPTIIAGGFPCQDISLAGKGAGLDGERSGLWRYYSAAIRALRPQGVLVENVSALLSRGLDRVLGDLAACGYDAEWDCIPAAAVGAPHLRDRVFIVAYRADTQDAHGRGERSSSGRGEPRARRDAVADAHGAGRFQQRWPVPAPEELATAQRGCGLPHVRGIADNAVCRRHGRQDEAVRAGRESPELAGWWRAEPGVARVGHGIPSSVDRRRGLGNAVVPAVAEHVGRILLDRMEVPA